MGAALKLERDCITSGWISLKLGFASASLATIRGDQTQGDRLPHSRYVAALPKLSLNLSVMKYLRKGAAMMYVVKRSGVPIYHDSTEIVIAGEKRAETVEFRAGGRAHRVDANVVALHQGVVPNQ